MDRKKLSTLFFSTLKLSACTFGGGFVIIPLMKKKFVDQLGWIGEDEMLDLTAIAQSSPGAIAVNAAILVGYKVAGILGAFISLLGTVIPPLTIISVVSLFYQAFRDNHIVQLVMSGMLCGVAAVILDVVVNMISSLFKQKRVLPILTLVIAFVAVRFFSVNIAVIILICGALGACDTIIRERRERK